MTELVATGPSNLAEQIVQQITSGTLSLERLAEIADGGLIVQNAFTRVRIIAERQIAQQYLFGDDEYTENIEKLKRRGWTPSRIRSAEKAVQLELPEIDRFIDSHNDSHKEATAAGVRALRPVTPPLEDKGIAQAYSVPPIDVQIAREFGVEAADARAELLAQSVGDALHSMPNQKHAFVWAKYHGINDDGTMGDAWTFEGIAKNMPDQKVVTREYVESLYYRASSHVYQCLARDAWNQVARLMMA